MSREEETLPDGFFEKLISEIIRETAGRRIHQPRKNRASKDVRTGKISEPGSIPDDISIAVAHEALTRRTTHKYRGSLKTAVPLSRETIRYFREDPQRIERQDFGHFLEMSNLSDSFRDKIALLFLDLGITEDDEAAWKYLAWSLAARHVPGFRVKVAPPSARQPANRKYHGTDAFGLILEVLRAKIEIAYELSISVDSVSYKAACQRAIDRSPTKWPGRKREKMNARDLQKRFKEACDEHIFNLIGHILDARKRSQTDGAN